MTERYVDFAYGRPGGKAIRDAGYSGVIRYLTRTANKRLTSCEVRDYVTAGLKVHAVYEDGAGQAFHGFEQGMSDGRYARDQAVTLGWKPDDGGCIYFAVDVDVRGNSDLDKVVAYFEGIATILPARHVGVYGDSDVINAVRHRELANYAWLTAATAWNQAAMPAVDIRQRVGGYTIAGVQVDANTVQSDDTGAWFRSVREGSAMTNPMDEHPDSTNVIPLRRLATYGEWIAQGLPDAIGMVGEGVAAVAGMAGATGANVSLARADIAALVELVKTNNTNTGKTSELALQLFETVRALVGEVSTLNGIVTDLSGRLNDAIGESQHTA